MYDGKFIYFISLVIQYRNTHALSMLYRNLIRPISHNLEQTPLAQAGYIIT